jgi:hypothetical protein
LEQSDKAIMSFVKKYLLLPLFLLLTCNAFSQIDHQGVFGAPFSGVSRDVSGSIVNQIGPISDFAKPTDLTAIASKNTLLSGESSPLQAALLLDDGTLTHLPASAVQWSSVSDQISIEGSLVTAKVIPRKYQVALQARSHGLTTLLFIRLKPGETAFSALDNSQLPLVLVDSVRLPQSGWKESNWFGTFYQPNKNVNWLMHKHHGWLYSAEVDANSLWLWSPDQKWLWTGPELYPHLYRHKDSTWIYLMVQMPGKTYYNFSTKSFERSFP